MTPHEETRYERSQIKVFLMFALLLLTAASAGVALFSDREGFLRDQAVKRMLAEQREAEREFGPVIPVSFNL